MANRAHARHGTTSIFPTTTTGTTDEIDQMLEACAEVRDLWSAMKAPGSQACITTVRTSLRTKSAVTPRKGDAIRYATSMSAFWNWV